MSFDNLMAWLDKEKEKESQGKGKYLGRGLYSDEIDEIMKPLESKGYMGTIASDEIPTLVPNAKPRMSFIMNLDPSTKKGSHWVAVYIDARNHGDQSIEYYDSFADDPPKRFMEDIKLLIDKIEPETYLKFKVNKIVQQRADSDSCGWFAMRFLMDRYNGVPFKEATPYSEVLQGEKDIKKFKEKYEKFGYI